MVEYEKMGCNVKWHNVEVEFGRICKEESVEARMTPFQAADCDLSLKLWQKIWLNANPDVLALSNSQQMRLLVETFTPEQRILKFFLQKIFSLHLFNAK